MVRMHTVAGKVAGRLEAVMEALRPAAAIDAPTAFYALCLACHDAIDELAASSVPPVSGGSPGADDFEGIDPGWPARPDPECDGWRWSLGHEGPTPLDVLAADAPARRPSAEDWSEMTAWSDSPWSDADQVAAHGHA